MVEGAGAITLSGANGVNYKADISAAAIVSGPSTSKVAKGAGAITLSCANGVSYTSDTSTVAIVSSTLTLLGLKTTASVPALQAGSGFELLIYREEFEDVAGTAMAADILLRNRSGQVHSEAGSCCH